MNRWYGYPMEDAGELKGFAIGFVGPERYPSGGRSFVYRAWWRRISTGKERVACVLSDTKDEAIQCARDCVDCILGEGRYSTLDPSEEQTMDDYPLRKQPVLRGGPSI